MNKIKEALRQQRPVWGAAVTMDSFLVAEALASTGIDFVLLDLEHGLLNVETLHQMVSVFARTNTAAFARLAGDDSWQLKRALDTGVLGIVAPFVNGAAQARAIVRGCKYPPVGVRGLGCQFAALRWGVSVPEYLSQADAETLVVVQAETVQAVEQIDEIAATEGLDMIFVGPADLSANVGMPLQTSHPLVEQCVEQVAKAARKAGVALGTVARTQSDIRRRIDQGFTFLVITSDTSCLIQGVTGALDQARQLLVQRVAAS